jgi:hypothetical protein
MKSLIKVFGMACKPLNQHQPQHFKKPRVHLFDLSVLGSSRNLQTESVLFAFGVKPVNNLETMQRAEGRSMTWFV